jgi:hypothetical protein
MTFTPVKSVIEHGNPLVTRPKRSRDSRAEPDTRTGSNPWLPSPQHTQAPTPVREVQLSGPSAPQLGVPVVEGGLPIRSVDPASHDGTVAVLGCSGGSGESSLATVLDGYACAHAWPAAGGPVVLCARTTALGLRAAQGALAQWAARSVSAEVLGLALVQDTPDRRPKPLRDLERIVGSGAPHVWEIPWIAEWRNDQARIDTAPRQVKSLIADVQTLLTQRSRSA